MFSPETVRAESVGQRLLAGEPVLLMDARSPDEWRRADLQLAGSLRIRPSEVENHLRLIPQGRPVVTYCGCPEARCSRRAAEALIENGWKDVHPLAGGFDAALAAGLPTEARAPEDEVAEPAR